MKRAFTTSTLHVCAKKTRSAAIFIFALILPAPMSRAQNFRGSIVGEVVDTTGARVPSAKIVARSLQTSFERQAISDAQGEFRLADLPPGPYRLTVSASGFMDATSDVSAVVSSVQDVSVALKPAAVQQSVTVKAEASSITTEPIDITSAVHGGAVSARDLANIPLAHRTFANIAFLV